METGNKQKLYNDVIRIKRFMGYHPYQYGLNMVKEFKSFGIKLDTIPFKTSGLRGMAIIGEKPDPDVILLNSNRCEKEQNFDCGHEMIHLSLHRNLDRKTFNCFDRVSTIQDPFLEWQANEGSAEYYVPHKNFIIYLKEHLGFTPSREDVENFITWSSDYFFVPKAVIRYRIENLKYEILQHYAGTDIMEIRVMSKSQQEKRGLYLSSLNDIPSGTHFDILSYIELKNRPVRQTLNGFTSYYSP